MKKNAFTMAEILLTLVIIGVIASMTIPTLTQNTKNNEYVAGCLKAYSTLSQAVDRMKPDYGPVGIGAKWNNADVFWSGENRNFKEGFASQFNTVRVEKSNNTTCYSHDMKYLNGTKDTNHKGYTLVTTDGMCYNFATDKCADKGVSTANCMGRFLVDVNGEKGPNVFGKDIFFFVLVKGDGIIPAGAHNSSANCKIGGNGTDCAAKVINEKKIDYKK